jgi:uncharacterized protein YycO
MVLIQMHKGTSLFSRLIRWFSRSTYSHVSVWFVDLTDPHGGTVIESIEPNGVREVPADWYRAARGDGRITLYAYRHPMNTWEQHAMAACMRKEIGAAYDWAGVFRFVTRRRHAHDDRWFCSEIAAHASAAAGRPLFEQTEPWEVQPGDIPRSPVLVRASDPERSAE